MSTLEKLKQACELGLLEQAKALSDGLDLTNMVGENGWSRYPTTIYSYCSTLELVQYFESKSVIPTYYDIINIGQNEQHIAMFDYLLPRYDFVNMEKKEDYLRGFNEAVELMPDNPILFVILKDAFKYQKKAIIDHQIDAFKTIDWTADFIIENSYGNAKEPLMPNIATRYIKNGGYYKSNFEDGMQADTKAWLTTLLEEYQIYDFRIFPTLLLYRATELVEKYIQKDPQALADSSDLLSLMMYHTNGESYLYKQLDKNKNLYSFNYQEDARNKILRLLIDHGYHFIEKETLDFAKLLTGEIILSHLGNIVLKINKEPFWQMLTDIQNVKKVSLFHLNMTWQELEFLDQYGYFEHKEKALYTLINNFRKDGYAYNQYEDIKDTGTSNEYKALALINQGITLSAEDQVQLLLTYKDYNESAVNQTSRVNHTLIIKVVCEKLATQETSELLLNRIKKMNSYDAETFFQHYTKIKQKLLDTIKSEILLLDNVKNKYVKYYLKDENEIYHYVNLNKTYYTQPQPDHNGQLKAICLGDYGQFGEQLLSGKNFEGFKGIIRFIKEREFKH